MKPVLVGHTSAVEQDHGPARRVRPSPQAKPRLEVLETRCLMSHFRPGLSAHSEYVLPPPNAAIANERAVVGWSSHRAITSNVSDGRSTVVRPSDADPDAMIPG